VLRIPRIRRLQTLGLLLSRITDVLRATEEDRPLRRVLGRVADESDEQMRLLETRRERLRTLLAEVTFDALHDSTEMPQIVELARAWLAE
jgi:DNA-binding transcriptional MerR regulator